MKEFFVGLLVIFMTALLSIVGIFLFPLLIVAAFFLRWIIFLLLALIGIWLIGKLTLFIINAVGKRN